MLLTQNRFKEVLDISYNLITVLEQLFGIKFEKYVNFAHFTFLRVSQNYKIVT